MKARKLIKKGRPRKRPGNNPGQSPQPKSNTRTHRFSLTWEFWLVNDRGAAMAFERWTKDQDVQLKALCQIESLSYGDIAATLSIRWGVEISRSAVGQRSRRKGFRSHEARNKAVVRATTPRKPEPRWQPPPVEEPRYIPGLAFLDLEPHAPGILMINASSRQCRWPVHGTGSSMRVCGDPVKLGSSYCEACHARAFRREAGSRQDMPA